MCFNDKKALSMNSVAGKVEPEKPKQQKLLCNTWGLLVVVVAVWSRKSFKQVLY